METELEQAYAILKKHGQIPFVVLRVQEVKEYISEYAQCLGDATDSDILKAIDETWATWDCSEDWRFIVESVMDKLENKESTR